MAGQTAHIGLTAEWIGTQAGGLEAYSRSLITALAERQSRHRFTAYTARKTALDGVAGLQRRYVGTGSRALYHGAALPIELMRRSPDLLHVTSIPPLYSRVPYVMTLHDMGHKVMPDMYPPRIRWRLDKTISLGIRRAMRIICVSQATRSDLLQYHPEVNPDRIDVVAEGGLLPTGSVVDADSDETILHRLGLKPGYFLYVGRLHVRKNLLRLIDAFARLPKTLQQAHPLKLVGRQMYGGSDITDRIQSLGLEDVVHLAGHVEDADLPAVYRGAMAFVYPSLFEGFGLPPLEAMSQGVPVICSDRHSLPEVVDDAGLCVDTTDINALASAMLGLAENSNLRKDLTDRGMTRARRFTWDRTAVETIGVYDKALAEIARRGNRTLGHSVDVSHQR
ncbi:MAG: glycosyltransferase family 1 protein [Paracoccaceae bacterium]